MLHSDSSLWSGKVKRTGQKGQSGQERSGHVLVPLLKTMSRHRFGAPALRMRCSMSSKGRRGRPPAAVTQWSHHCVQTGQAHLNIGERHLIRKRRGKCVGLLLSGGGRVFQTQMVAVPPRAAAPLAPEAPGVRRSMSHSVGRERGACLRALPWRWRAKLGGGSQTRPQTRARASSDSLTQKFSSESVFYKPSRRF